MPQFDLTIFPVQIFWLVIFFTVLMVYTVRVSVPRMKDLLDERWQRTEGFKISAEKFRGESESIKQAGSDVVQEARKSAQHLMNLELEKIAKKSAADREKIQSEISIDFQKEEAKAIKLFESELANIELEAIEVTSNVVEALIGIKPSDAEIKPNVNDNFKQAIAK